MYTLSVCITIFTCCVDEKNIIPLSYHFISMQREIIIYILKKSPNYGGKFAKFCLMLIDHDEMMSVQQIYLI